MRVRDHDEKSRKYVHGNSIINLKILCNFTVEKTLEPIFIISCIIFPLGNIFFRTFKKTFIIPNDKILSLFPIPWM